MTIMANCCDTGNRNILLYRNYVHLFDADSKKWIIWTKKPGTVPSLDDPLSQGLFIEINFCPWCGMDMNKLKPWEGRSRTLHILETGNGNWHTISRNFDEVSNAFKKWSKIDPDAAIITLNVPKRNCP